jgi:molecular chaperone HscB
LTASLPDHFALLGLQRRFALDEQALDRAHKRVQSQVHPDRFAAGSAAERRVAMQWAARANDAFETLRSPLKRATYLCESGGVAIDAESNTAMPAAFLQQQMQWREALDDARAGGGPAALQALVEDARARRQAIVGELARVLDELADCRGAAPLVRQLMFVERFLEELAAAAAHMEH